MATYFRGNFKDIYDNNINIEIVSPNGQAEYNLDDEDSPVKIAYDSIEISYDMDDMFQTVIKKQMSLNLTSKIYLGDIIFSDKVRQVSVTVMKNDDIVFSGYVEPYTYSQPFAAVWEEFTINCIDKLGILEYEYLVKHTRWQEYLAREDTPSFADYLELIFDNEKVYYDGSKTTKTDLSLFDNIGISYKPFLGKDADDMMTNEEVIDEILKYFNLHIIQEGEDFYIFDWNTIKSNTSKTFVNIFDNTDTKTIDLTKKIITKDSYKSDDTNISMSETYNQISLKADLDFIDEVIASPLDPDNIRYYSNYKQLWFTDYICFGTGSTSAKCFQNIVKQAYEHFKYINEDWDGWTSRSWFFKLAYNPEWKFMWNGDNIESWIERDNQNNVINQHRILEAMRNYKFFPCILSAGQNQDSLNKDNQSMVNYDGDFKGKVDMNNYIAISVNGHYNDDTQAELERIQENINIACNYTGEDTSSGIMEYIGNANYSLSPSDQDTTNYLILNCKLVLCPVLLKSGYVKTVTIGSQHSQWANYSLASDDTVTLKQQYQGIINPPSPVDVQEDGDKGRYAQQFYTAENPGDEEQNVPDKLMIYPFMDNNPNPPTALDYNYSAHWDDTDKIDKLPILECELKVGNKYLVETYPDGDKLKPNYGWYPEDDLPYVKVDATHSERKRTFSIGIDPAIGKPLVGKEYEIANSVNAKIDTDKKGMAIPIRYDDGLSGRFHFKIIGPINQQWAEITRRHPSFWRSTKYSTEYKNFWSHISSIWIKDFGMEVISDNQGKDVDSSESDVIYISNETTDTIEKKDDIEFKVCTRPTTEELVDRGINTNVANNTTVYLPTNTPLDVIKDLTQNISNRPERLYIDQYWNIYSTPKAIIETTLDSSFGKINMVNFSDFGDAIPISIKQNLQFATTTIKAIQI